MAQKLAQHGASAMVGMLTYRPLVEFQQAHGIIPASGYFGPKTHAYVNALGGSDACLPDGMTNMKSRPSQVVRLRVIELAGLLDG